MAKKSVEMARYYGSEALRNKNLQKKAINYGLKKLTPVIENVGSEALDQLSTKIRPNKKYKTDRKDLDGGSLQLFEKVNDILTNPKKYKKYQRDLAKYAWNESVAAGYKGKLRPFLYTLDQIDILKPVNQQGSGVLILLRRLMIGQLSLQLIRPLRVKRNITNIKEKENPIIKMPLKLSKN